MAKRQNRQQNIDDAVNTLKNVLNDPDATASAKVAAATRILTLEGQFEDEATTDHDDTPLDRLPIEELEKLAEQAVAILAEAENPLQHMQPAEEPPRAW